MCRLAEGQLDICLLCRTIGARKCDHEVAVCSNQAVHPLWKVWYYKHSGGISTFQGCGFCKYAKQAELPGPAASLGDNPGWPGCCYPPMPKSYHWIPPEDWPLVAAYHRMEIPPVVQSAIDNMKRNMATKKAVSDRLTIDVASPRAVPIPKTNGHSGTQTRSYSPSAMHMSPSPRSSTSSKDSNSSGSPPSSIAGSRRGTYDFEGSDRSSPIGRSRAGSDDPRMTILSSSGQSRRNGSPVDRITRIETASGKRRSNSDPKHQPPPPPSAYERSNIQSKGRESPTQMRDRDRDSPVQHRSRSGSSTSLNHPYSNPHSGASSSMKRLNQVDSIPASTPRPPIPAPAPRAREAYGPSITSVMANMSLNSSANGSEMTAARLAQLQMEGKRGVIPPHVRKAGSVISAGSSSSSSTNSSAREGTVVSDGAFTDYLSDDSDLDLQRQAEIEAENAYQEALRKHEEMEFREARDSLVRAAQNTINDGYSSMPMGYSRRTHVGYSASTRIRV